MERGEALAAELEAARADFHATLAQVEPEALTRPGPHGEWGARELIAHLGYWAGRAVEYARGLEAGTVDEVYAARRPADEVNAIVARVARETPLEAVRAREAASVEVLLAELRRLDDTTFDVLLPSGVTFEALVRDAAIDHYREHADALRATTAERSGG